MFFVRFWGVRGSVACPGSDTLVFGGNTSCLEIRAGKKLVIIDLGTGSYGLGNYLVKHDLPKGPINADIFISHLHLDHLAGLQMFTPFFIDNTVLRIHGPHHPDKESLELLLGNQMSYTYWPVRLGELPASITFKQIGETELDLGDGLVCKTAYLNHPAICLSYRFEYQGKSIVTAFDHETYWNIFTQNQTDTAAGDFFVEDAIRSGEKAVQAANKYLIEFYKDADILIYDSQYTEEEYQNGKMYWGHSTFRSSIEAANETNAKKLIIYHHDPARTDAYLSRLAAECRANYGPRKDLEIIVSKEGMVVEP